MKRIELGLDNRKVKILLLLGKGSFRLFIFFPPELLCFREG